MPETASKKKNLTNICFGLLFGAVLLLLLADHALTPDRAYSRSEKRSLAAFPSLNAEALLDGEFMDSLEDYLADQFPLRESLMKLKSALDLTLGIRESQDVFYLSDGSLAERFTMPSGKKTEALLAELNDFGEEYSEDRTLTFLLAPTAVSIRTSLLPENALTDDQNAYIDGLYEGLSDRFTTLDVRDTFEERTNAGENLYYLTDHHWNTEGASLAASAYLQSVGIEETEELERGIVCNDFAGSLIQKSGYAPEVRDAVEICRLPQDPGNDFLYSVTYPYSHVQSASLYDADALSGDDPYQVFFGGNHPTVLIETSLDTGRNLLIIKDSFANCVVPFLVPYFDSVTMVDPRYYYDDLELLILENRFTDILFLYNANTLSEDSSLRMVLLNEQ